MPDELWMEVNDIVQERRIKTIPKKRKCKKAKWPSSLTKKFYTVKDEGIKRHLKLFSSKYKAK